MELLTFRAAGSTLGVPMDDVQEILDSWTLTPLPLLPEGFRGVANLRGKPVPVADLTAGSEAPRRAMVVLRSSIALLVDTIENVVETESLDDPQTLHGVALFPVRASL